MAERVIRTVCPHDCPDQCSILATVDGDRVIRVAGDPEHGFTGGFLCGKVNRYPERVHSPERLLTPLHRTGPKGSGAFVPISWEEALDEIARRWQETRGTYGPEALLGYAYSGNMGRVGRMLVKRLFAALGASGFEEGTVCDTACATGWEYSLGPTPGIDPETIGESDLIVCWGANVVTTNVHLVPFIDRARKRGARLIVIDPYRTRTARRADWHIAPRVGTDAALALGVMHVLVRDGLYDAAFVKDRSVGFEQLCSEVLPAYTPDRTAELTGVPAADVEQLAHLYGGAKAPFLRLGMGMSRHAGGGMTIRTVALLPSLVGAWGKPGGGALLDTGGIISLNAKAISRPEPAPADPVRSVNHSTLGRALLELQDPPIQALFVAGNNPAVTCPDQQRMVAGLSREDLFTVVHDTFLTDTARYADIVLPACTSFESEDLYRSYGSYYLQHSAQVLPPMGESRSNVWLVQQLAARLGLDDPGFGRSVPECIALLLDGSGLAPDQVLGAGPVKLAYDHKGPETTYFYSQAMAEAGLPPLPSYTPEAAPAGWPLRLLTAPGHSQHHTSFAGVDSLLQIDGEPCCLLHPADAGARGLQSGDPVTLWNERGEIGLYVTVTEDTQPGVVVVEGHRNRNRHRFGGPLNVLTSDGLTDMGEGATFQSTWVEIKRG